jgi:hypothetical protein
MTKEEVNLKVIKELNDKGYDAINMDFNLLNDFADILYKAINYTHCCTELPTSTQLLSDCKNRFKDLKANNYKFDYRSYQNGYLDSFSKYAVSKNK